MGYFWVARRFQIMDRPNERSSHTRPVLLGGGVIFFFSLLVYSLFHGFNFPLLLAGATMIALTCFVDDLRDLPSWFRMVIQLAALVLVFYQPLNGLEAWKILLVIVVFTGVLNIYNFMDGINGMLAIYSFVVVATFGYINLFVVHFVDMQLIASILLAIVIFGFFNFRTKAFCFSGDVGSVVMGLIVLFLLVAYVKAMPSASPSVSQLSFIIVFLADGVLTLLKRFLNGRNVFQPHREHLYETLTNDLHVPQLYVSSAYALLQLLINVGYFMVADKNLYIFVCTLVLVLFYGLFFYYFNQRKSSQL